ncbi:hypothetical protein [Winogradskya humida]|uniref:hypothetical protein n=1 Tax=Winogradskya humida TaxID=113566 RepID=UPI001EF2E126|nr:hypothetical protein [Actinoplanes humidus]
MALSSETPARLRLWSLAAMVAAGLLLIVLSAVMAAVKEQVRVIGEEAAPRAATASDLYFGLSDLDAQVARMMLIRDDDRFAAAQADALSAYLRRSDEIDADLQRAGTDAAALRLADGLAVYRRQAWQALSGESLGYYTQATNTLHLELLPAATELRDASQDQLADAYAEKRRTETAGIAVAVVLGGTVLVLLIGTQVFLARRFRRLMNPSLIAATGVAAVLIVALGTVLVLQAKVLADARRDSLLPYLALSQARAVSYDAAADTGRYLLNANYQQDFDRKAGALSDGDAGLAALSGSDEVGKRWLGYRADHERIVALADSGKRAEAIGALTGIRRGDAAFDFFYFDSAVGVVAERRQEEFAVALRDSDRLLAGWVVVPIAALGLVIALVPLGVRRRLAEFR